MVYVAGHNMPMNDFKITFENGDTLVTSMNATLEEAAAYYIGNAHGFQFGDTEACPGDKLVRAVNVEVI